MPIKVLDPKLVARIAAGEVVERPASVVKELVENSLDAGASQITVEVRGGGTSLIRVIDNGTGLPATEVELAFTRHATSKISDISDLESIASFGFRGEALPSIAAVADIDVVTCFSGEPAGTSLRLESGEVADKTSRGRSPGTTITVHNLFRNVPARRKFLKSMSTESSHIANVVSQYTLAFPEVKFTLLMDGKANLKTAGNGRLIDSIIEVYGIDVARNMLEVDSSESNWQSTTEPAPRVTGMVSAPSISRSNRSYLSFFVNRRWVNSRMLSWALEEAYHGLLMQGKHPIAIINIEVPPQEVDVNIHPAKIEVKFQKEHLIFATLQKAVRRALVSSSPVPKIEEVAAPYKPLPSVPQLWESLAGAASYPKPKPISAPPLVNMPLLRVLGQLASNYIVAEGQDGLYLIDQHAAHERILFEKVQGQKARQKVEVQGLLQPVTFDVIPRQDVVLKSHYTEFAEFGFDIEPFGDRTYMVRSVPSLVHEKDWMAVLREMMDSTSGNDWSESIAKSIACHGAVKAGQSLTDDEMRELLRQLEKTVLPRTCPHGRPTMIHISNNQLEREFGRS